MRVKSLHVANKSTPKSLEVSFLESLKMKFLRQADIWYNFSECRLVTTAVFL